jgi:pimeloyl-ACP methyl ester carboxylesterase
MLTPAEPLAVRTYGPPGMPVVVLHGGPGAPGSAELLARGLAGPFHVLEPLQRRSSAVPLTVEHHIEDLRRVIADHLPEQRPALVGESWGAMLGLAYAAEYPQAVSALALVGCGTFDPQARARLRQTLDERTSPELRERIARLSTEVADESERLAQEYALSAHLYTYHEASGIAFPNPSHVDAQGHRESWADMVRLQEAGVFPSRFCRIVCRVLMLHGSYDPHPGQMIRESLMPHIPQLEYIELDRCGHSPWIEEYARVPFFAHLRTWLLRSAAWLDIDAIR